MLNILMIFIKNMCFIFCVVFLIIHSSAFGLPFGQTFGFDSHMSKESRGTPPFNATTQRRSIFSNVLKTHGIFVPKTPIRLLPKFGSVIDGSLRTKLFRWPKENTIEVKPIELSTFLKGVPKFAENFLAESAKLVAKPIPLKNNQNHQLLDFQGLNGEPPFSDGTFMDIPHSMTGAAPIRPSSSNHVVNHQKPTPPKQNSLAIPPSSMSQSQPSLSSFFGGGSDLFSSDFDILNDKFPENSGLPLWKAKPSPSASFSPFIPSLSEVLEFDRPFRPEPLLPRPISQQMNFPGHRPNFGEHPMTPFPEGKNNQPRPCPFTANNGNLNNGSKPNLENQKTVKKTDKNESKQGPIFFYRYDDPQIKNLPKDQLFPIFIPNPESSGTTTQLEVIVKKQETTSKKNSPSKQVKKRNRNQVQEKNRDDEDVEENSLDTNAQQSRPGTSGETDYADEYVDDLSGYDLKDAENADIFEDEEQVEQKSKANKVRSKKNHRNQPDDVYVDSPRSTSSSQSTSKVVKYHAVDNSKLRPRLTARPRLKFRSNANRMKPLASSIHNSRIIRGQNRHGISVINEDPNKVQRENKLKTGDRQTFDKGVERSKHRVFEHKQEEIWKEKKWNKGGKEETEVESVGTVTEKDKRGSRGGSGSARSLRYGDKKLRSEDSKYYDDPMEGEIPNQAANQDENDEEIGRASHVDQRYASSNWSPEINSSGWKKSHNS